MIREIEVSAIMNVGIESSSHVAISPDGNELYSYVGGCWRPYDNRYHALHVWNWYLSFGCKVWRGIFKIKVQS